MARKRWQTIGNCWRQMPSGVVATYGPFEDEWFCGYRCCPLGWSLDTLKHALFEPNASDRTQAARTMRTEEGHGRCGTFSAWQPPWSNIQADGKGRWRSLSTMPRDARILQVPENDTRVAGGSTRRTPDILVRDIRKANASMENLALKAVKDFQCVWLAQCSNALSNFRRTTRHPRITVKAHALDQT